MTLHISIISIQGDARQAITDYFLPRGYKIISKIECVYGLEGLTRYLTYSEDKAITYTEGRTNIVDPEMVMMLDEEMLNYFSMRFGSVLTMISEGMSGTYGYSVYLNGERLRNVLVVDGEIGTPKGVGTPEGNPIPEESGIDLSLLYEDSLSEILSRLGFNFSSLDKVNSYSILENTEISHEAKHTFGSFRFPYRQLLKLTGHPSRGVLSQIEERKKNWWKFWR